MDSVSICYREGLQPLPPKKREREKPPPLFLTNFTDLSQLQSIAMHDSDESNCHDVSF